ncbi:MAG: TrmH family RNA methyltransferase [Acidimicrobiia bacterium]
MSKQLDGTGMKRLHRSWRAHTSGRVSLILDGLGSPFNVGSIMRSAASYRVEQAWFSGATPPVESSGVQRTALGTDRYLDVHRMDSTVSAIEAATAAGYTCVALELTEDATPLHLLAPTLGPDVCLVIGHEDHGVSKPALAAVSAVTYLPMLGKVGSLNVATAAAIAIYELRRRTWPDSPT